MPNLPSIPPTFAVKKAAILTSLALPASKYSDLSPKGSVDEAIIPLINKINKLEGVVTTSSCAGRVSIFLEGRKSKTELDDGRSLDYERAGEDAKDGQVAVPGGKGKGGRWLFVSHQPVDVGQAVDANSPLLNFLSDAGQPEQKSIGNRNGLSPSGTRFVRFQFEPMILHVMTASLAHASSVLAAAMNAGFRESGVQSLKNLDDPSNAFPMVAVRTSGLAFESLIGYAMEDSRREQVEEDLNEEPRNEKAQDEIQRLVSKDYFLLLLKIANERFRANHQRMQRFETSLFKEDQRKGTVWEETESRQVRKRADGLARREALNHEKRVYENGS